MPQYISKVILNGVTQMDVTQDTVAANNLLQGETATKNDGSPVSGSIGTMTLPSSTSSSSAGSYKSDIYPSESTKYLNLGAGYNSTAKYYRVLPMAIQDTTITRNGVYNPHDADNDGWGTVTVAVPESTFVVTISYDSQDDTWKPDRTFAQIQAAYQAGKTIAVVTESFADAITDGEYIDEGGSDDVFAYCVGVWYQGDFVVKHYILDSNGIQDDGESTYIYPNFETVTKTYTPTESAQTETVTFDSSNYNGLQEVDVTVNAISSSYVGSGITRRDSTDLSESGATITAPAGYYANSASKSVASGSATPAASISGTSATVSTGTNTLTLSKTVSNTPQVSAGYVSAGTAGNTNVSLTANVTTKAAATITPTTSNQTIASGTYLTGAQTISGDANLVAGNIKSGTTIFGVTGTYSGGGSSKNIQAYMGRASRTANSYGATSVTLTVAKTGTYNVSWCAWRSSSSGTMGTNLHVNSTSGTNQQTFTNTYGQCITLKNQQYNQGDVLTLYATSGSNSRTINVANLIIEEQ